MDDPSANASHRSRSRDPPRTPARPLSRERRRDPPSTPLPSRSLPQPGNNNNHKPRSKTPSKESTTTTHSHAHLRRGPSISRTTTTASSTLLAPVCGDGGTGAHAPSRGPKNVGPEDRAAPASLTTTVVAGAGPTTTPHQGTIASRSRRSLTMATATIGTGDGKRPRGGVSPSKQETVDRPTTRPMRTRSHDSRKKSGKRPTAATTTTRTTHVLTMGASKGEEEEERHARRMLELSMSLSNSIKSMSGSYLYFDDAASNSHSHSSSHESSGEGESTELEHLRRRSQQRRRQDQNIREKRGSSVPILTSTLPSHLQEIQAALHRLVYTEDDSERQRSVVHPSNIPRVPPANLSLVMKEIRATVVNTPESPPHLPHINASHLRHKNPLKTHRVMSHTTVKGVAPDVQSPSPSPLPRKQTSPITSTSASRVDPPTVCLTKRSQVDHGPSSSVTKVKAISSDSSPTIKPKSQLAKPKSELAIPENRSKIVSALKPKSELAIPENRSMIAINHLHGNEIIVSTLSSGEALETSHSNSARVFQKGSGTVELSAKFPSSAKRIPPMHLIMREIRSKVPLIFNSPSRKSVKLEAKHPIGITLPFPPPPASQFMDPPSGEGASDKTTTTIRSRSQTPQRKQKQAPGKTEKADYSLIKGRSGSLISSLEPATSSSPIRSIKKNSISSLAHRKTTNGASVGHDAESDASSVSTTNTNLKRRVLVTPNVPGSSDNTNEKHYIKSPGNKRAKDKSSNLLVPTISLSISSSKKTVPGHAGERMTTSATQSGSIELSTRPRAEKKHNTSRGPIREPSNIFHNSDSGTQLRSSFTSKKPVALHYDKPGALIAEKSKPDRQYPPRTTMVDHSDGYNGKKQVAPGQSRGAPMSPTSPALGSFFQRHETRSNSIDLETQSAFNPGDAHLKNPRSVRRIIDTGEYSVGALGTASTTVTAASSSISGSRASSNTNHAHPRWRRGRRDGSVTHSERTSPVRNGRKESPSNIPRGTRRNRSKDTRGSFDGNSSISSHEQPMVKLRSDKKATTNLLSKAVVGASQGKLNIILAQTSSALESSASDEEQSMHVENLFRRSIMSSNLTLGANLHRTPAGQSEDSRSCTSIVENFSMSQSFLAGFQTHRANDDGTPDRWMSPKREKLHHGTSSISKFIQRNQPSRAARVESDQTIAAHRKKGTPLATNDGLDHYSNSVVEASVVSSRSHDYGTISPQRSKSTSKLNNRSQDNRSHSSAPDITESGKEPKRASHSPGESLEISTNAGRDEKNPIQRYLDGRQPGRPELALSNTAARTRSASAPRRSKASGINSKESTATESSSKRCSVLVDPSSKSIAQSKLVPKRIKAKPRSKSRTRSHVESPPSSEQKSMDQAANSSNNDSDLYVSSPPMEDDVFTFFSWSMARQNIVNLQQERESLKEEIRHSVLYTLRPKIYF